MSFLIIHIGAGKHSTQLNDKYKRLLKSALRTRCHLSSSRIIEESPLTNTGYGSSLDEDGNAMCDSTYVEIQNHQLVELLTLQGIDNKKHPTAECYHVLQALCKNYESTETIGLLKPVLLLYKTIESKYGSSASENIISSKARRTHELCRELVETANTEVQDTVGFIEYNAGKFTLSVSSGGNLFKMPGRVSCAGVYGSGLSYAIEGNTEVICMCSGNGDDIIKMNLAAHLADRMAQLGSSEAYPDYSAALAHYMLERGKQTSLSARDSQMRPTVYGGAIAVIKRDGSSRLAYAHSTESFYFGFLSGEQLELVFSRRQNIDGIGKMVYGEYKLI